MNTYHIFLNQQIKGPYTRGEIESRILDKAIVKNTLIAVDGGGWAPAADLFPSMFPQSNTNLGSSVTADSVSRNPSTSQIMDPPLRDYSPVVKFDGIGRLAFTGYTFVILLIIALFSTLVNGTQLAGVIAGFIMMIPASSRLKNIGRNPAWCLLLLVPLLGLFVTVPCFLLPPGYQKNRKLDLPAKIILGIFISLLVVAIISLTNLV
jgi:hypothetical protein